MISRKVEGTSQEDSEDPELLDNHDLEEVGVLQRVIVVDVDPLHILAALEQVGGVVATKMRR